MRSYDIQVITDVSDSGGSCPVHYIPFASGLMIECSAQEEPLSCFSMCNTHLSLVSLSKL